MQFDIRRFDIYRKVPKDLTQPTFTGAIISISSCLFMMFLFLSELTDYMTTKIESQLFVDDPVSHEDKISVNLNISLPRMQCKYVGLDIQDDLGRHDVGFVENTDKKDIEDGRGCLFTATFHVNKVPGNFHVSTHSSQEQPTSPDMNHVIHSLVFGSDIRLQNIPASFNPLKEKIKLDSNGLSTHDYFLKVVPTVFQDLSGSEKYPYQYTFSYRAYMNFGHGHQVMPAIWFRYDLSPITVRYTERRRPFYSFLTMVCAIVGGTFTVAGIIDSCIFTAHEIFKKAELGKLS